MSVSVLTRTLGMAFVYFFLNKQQYSVMMYLNTYLFNLAYA